MSFSKISALSGLVAFATKVAAHGRVYGIVADGIYYPGYNMDSQYMASPIDSVGWSDPEDLGNGFIAPDAYATSDIICHLNATNALLSAPVAAGGVVELQWSAWPSSHHGPVIDYLANCGGDCATVDKTTLEWFKIDGVGLIDDTTVPGTWATDQLIANNNSWSVTIPSDLVAGNYVLRHEIIALHSAEESDGAQNYPQCVNLEITGTGTASPDGTLGTALYTETDAGILVNIYASLASYEVPGPTMYSNAVSMSQTQAASATADAVGTAETGGAVAVAETTAAAQATSAAVVSVVASSAQASVTASSAQVTSAPAVTSASYTNSTVSTSSKKSKSACKAKTSSALVAEAVSSSKTKSACKAKSSSTLNVATLNAAVVTSTSIEASVETSAIITVSAASVTIATTSSSVETSAASTSTAEASTSTGNNKSATVSEPTGTTLGDLLSWLSSFYTSHSDSTYDAATVARRHARDIAQRDMDKFDAGKHSQATGTAARGVAKGTGVARSMPSGTGSFGGKGGAKPTGAFGGKGGAMSTGAFAAGSAMPTAARHFAHAGM